MSLSSLVDKPLMQNPLAGGSQLGGLNFRQEGDMGRYVADNDPGGVAAGFSNLQDYLAAGNKLPELNDPFSNITAPGQIPDRYKKGFEEFYRQNPDDYMRIGGQAISYVTTPQGETIQFGDTGGATNFRRYLESIGETPRDDSLSLVQESNPLKTVSGPNDILSGTFNDMPLFPPKNTFIDDMRDKSLDTQLQDSNVLQSSLRGVNPVNNNQFGGFDDRLTKIEEGIASLLQNRGQQFNFGMQPRFDFGMQPRFNMSGLGYFFNPQGGFYG